MRIKNAVSVGVACLALGCGAAMATERFFTYSYEPEVFPQGAAEFEQHVTLRAGRDKVMDQENYNAWELREEFEYGVTDRYSVSFYLNTKAESFRKHSTGTDESSFDFDGVSIENRYMVLNPAEHAIGLTLYFEPRYSGEELELEQKIILGQRCGDWKWALNLTHAAEWSNNLHDLEGELELSFGITRHLNKRWSVGLEARDHNELPEYKEWENTAVFIGPVVAYTQENWWATLTVMPQVYGKNFSGTDPDGSSWQELEGHEKVNARLIFGIGF
jgi:hypothetical protein